jgi:hypothetical protein
MRLAALSAWIVVLATTQSVRADAEEVDVDVPEARTAALSWVRLPGAETCPSTQALAQAAEAILGHTVFVSASSASLSFEGRAEPRAGGGFRATIRVADALGAPLGERVVEVEGTCDTLLDPLAIVLAVLVDPEAHEAPAVVDPEEADHEPEVRIETQVITERVEVPVLVPAPPWRLDVDLGGVLVLGLTPFVTGGGHASFFLTPPGFVPIGLHGVIAPFSRAELGGGANIDQLAFWAGVTICPLAVREDRFSFAACAGVDVGAVIVIGGSAGAAPLEHERFTVGADVSVRAGVHLVGPLALVLSAALVVPFRTEGWQRGAPATTYYVPEPVGLVVSLGPSFGFEL